MQGRCSQALPTACQPMQVISRLQTHPHREPTGDGKA